MIQQNRKSVGVKRIFPTPTNRLMLFMNSRREADTMKLFIDKTLPDLTAKVIVSAVSKVVLSTRHTNVPKDDVERAVMEAMHGQLDYITIKEMRSNEGQAILL